MWELLWLGTVGTDALKLKSVTECKYDILPSSPTSKRTPKEPTQIRVNT